MHQSKSHHDVKVEEVVPLNSENEALIDEDKLFVNEFIRDTLSENSRR